MHVILTGATGLVGGGVLHHILSLTPTAATTKHISRVSILSRKPDIALLNHPHRPTTNTHTKINVIPHSDFSVYPSSLFSALRSESQSDSDAIAVIWALGMSQNDATSPAQYVEVTKTYAVNAAKAFATAFAPSHVNFVYVSGEGATANPGMFTPMFGKVKGETEQELLDLANGGQFENLSVFNVRPAAVDAGGKNGGQRAVEEISSGKDKSLVQRGLKAVLFPVLRAGIGGGMYSPTAELGRVLVNLGVGDGKALKGVGVEDGGWTVRNVGLRRLGAEMD